MTNRHPRALYVLTVTEVWERFGYYLMLALFVLYLNEKLKMSVADSLSGQELPYATLMYVTSSVAATGQRIVNPHTRRIQMYVAGKAEDALGRWVALERDVEADFRAAFGEAPKKMLAYGVMSDSDNTGTEAEAWYGDISFSARH